MLQEMMIYAGTFDPPTYGHLWLIQEAASLFSHIVVAVGFSLEKKTTYSLDERLMMLQNITKDIDNVSIDYFKNMYLAEYAHQKGAKGIVRGIRSMSDYEYERIICYVNADICPSISTVFLFPPREYSEISSTLVKSLIGFKNWQKVIRQYVPEAVALLMEEKTKNPK
jgi:pantetheine-phosphate adenylyltransferase